MSAGSRIGGRRVLIIAALATAVVIGYVATQTLQSAAVYYLTPTEAAKRGIAPGQAYSLTNTGSGVSTVISPSGSAGAQTPWIQPINGNGFALTGAGAVSASNPIDARRLQLGVGGDSDTCEVERWTVGIFLRPRC